MNVIPAPPTDTLAKFITIFCLWILVFSSGSFVYRIHLSEEYKYELHEGGASYNARQRVSSLNRCRSTLETVGSLDETLYKNCELSPEKTRSELLVQIDEEVTRLQPLAYTKPSSSLSAGRLIRYYNRFNLDHILLCLGFISFFAFVFGAVFWQKDDIKKRKEDNLRFQMMQQQNEILDLRLSKLKAEKKPEDNAT